MKKLRLTLSALLGVMLLTAAMSTVAFADDAIPEVTFDADTELFTYKNTSMFIDDGVEYPNLFVGFDEGLIPGDSFEQEITFKTENIDGQTVNVYLNSENETGDHTAISEFDAIVYEVYCDGVEISSGTLADGIMLGTFTTDETVTLTVVFEIPLETGNEVANLYGTIDWVFIAEIVEDPADDDTDDPDDPSDPDDPDDPSTTPQTGDSNIAFWVAIVMVAAAGVLVFAYKKSSSK